ncbi:MAG TPA: multifunctional oxoglutarate decarboxylase/oxoglutarate dehydrogenase thiamine pyrophosphate-binding subunit/dihydrolipoyllysine-residue succinyltransferase subunit [Actinomycetes bacterium]|jgi:2-oxoglutarate dehydrogenase E1 component|nr:multifunctional oxoglutarate decarboxylase/oxoglutarate dehydrogenase thiamine pyrophosphate-binding subunit/dihydrolipoyllysine-residue succinyltransferase subunit [Actinomycetes bacterium]
MGWFERPEFGANVGLIDEIYRQYLDNPESVSPAWREFFAENEPQEAEQTEAAKAPSRSAAPATQREAPPARPSAPAEPRQATAARAEGPAAAKPAAPASKGQDEATAAAEGDGKAADLVPLRGAAARIVEAMEASRAVPTATSVRTVPARLLEVNRSVLNGHLRRRQGGKVSFTHMIAYAVIRALDAVPVMTTMYREVDGKPNAARPEHVNLGLAVDTRRPDGSRTLLVPNIKQADTLDFAGFVRAYEEIVARVKANKLTVKDFADTTLTITNPGTIGTVLSVPRLMAGQSAIIGVGAIDYPAEYQGSDPQSLADMGIGKVVTLTSTYDHRVIQGAESGEFLARMHRLLLGEDDFYADVFASMTVPYVPVQWHKDEKPSQDSLEAIEKQAHVLQLINLYRVRGHLIANLDPLKAKPPKMHPELDPASYGFTIWDLERRFVTGGLAGRRELPLGEILHLLRDAYCRTGTVEYMHNSHTDEKEWIQAHVEGVPHELSKEDQLQILHKLSETEAFERFLHNKYTGHKRFSLEGGESLIPMLDAVLDKAADADMEGAVIGMSHRGRLNVLANTVGKSYGEIFGEFEGNLDPTLTQGSGDVKYHLGAVGKHVARSGKEVRVEVASNPSHLEAVNPVVEGIARARQDQLDRGEEAPVLPVLIHGDAAFAGQGVVAETLNLSQLRGYRTGGTVHIVVNNQVGFTTSPDYGRSSTYATDVAKMIQAPIFHVNGDDPEACVRVARLAFDFRQAFKKDVVIDMWCYRRYGHNEADEPSFTQPLMYERIKARRPVRKLYTEALVNRGDLSVEDAERSLEEFRQRLQQAFDDTRGEEDSQVAKVELERPAPMAADPAVDTTVDRATLDQLLVKLTTVPDGFNVHPKLSRWLEQRAGALERNAVDWALGEALAYGSLLQEGRTIRLSGQDTRRGTFSQRHSALVDQRTGEQYAPLANLGESQGRFFVYDSLLSEFAAMGFEYGYSVANPDALVLWEAQFGDFVNGAQIIVDQFISAAEDKWGQRSSLVLLLPHGFEGQGPEHSSARLERFLDLAAEDNMQVAYPSTPAQYFHLLRRQAMRANRKPLIVMTPKSLLRLPAARSTAEQLTGGQFHEVLPDPERPSADQVTRVLLCSGKVFYELAKRRSGRGVARVALLRVEQLYPFPARALRSQLDAYPNARQRLWVQEEPENMGAWRYLRLKTEQELGVRLEPVSRDEGAAPAAGSPTLHQQEQQELLDRAFAGL